MSVLDRFSEENVWRNEYLAERLLRSGILILCLALFLLIPMRIVAYGYVPGDDALRHSAYAVADRAWGDIMLLNPELRPDFDAQAGWHSFLRAVHKVTGWSPTRLVDFSVILAFLVFTVGGLIASGHPGAWFLGCALMTVINPHLFAKLMLGRPLFLTMTAVVILNFIWARARPLRWPLEAGVIFLVLTINLTAHSSAWYLWALAVPPLVICQRWRSLKIFAGAWIAAIAAASLINGGYNTVMAPLMAMKLGIVQANTFGTNLVGEFQPSNAPFIGLVVPIIILTVKWVRGVSLRQELLQVDLCFVVLTWILGLYVGRFWIEWGLPALAVWLTRQIRDGLDLKPSGLQRRWESVGLFAVAASVMYLAQTADSGGRWTNPLRYPLLWTPLHEFVSELPEEGGTLYSVEMGTFYGIFHRLPQANFRFALTMEPGLMPTPDLKVLRAVQSTGRLVEYKPWFDKMTPKDRILIRQASKPEWPQIEFRQFFDGWMGRKVTP